MSAIDTGERRAVLPCPEEVVRSRLIPMGSEKAKVLLIDDHPIVFLAVKTLLEQAGDFLFCGRSLAEMPALDQVRQESPDLIILDLLLDGRNGLELIPGIHVAAPEARVVVYSSLDEMRNAPRAFRSGAMGYVMKKEPPSMLLQALSTVRNGKRHASETVKQLLMDEAIAGARSAGGIDELSNQQLQVFRLLGEGLSTHEVGAKLGISTKTVHSHRERIKDKLNLQSGSELQKSAEAYYRSEES